MKELSNKVKAIVMALALLFGMVMVPQMEAKADTPTTTISVSGIEEGCNVYAYAVVLDAVDANGNHYWKYGTGVEDRVKTGTITPSDMFYFYTNLNSVSDGADWNLHDGLGQAVVDQTVLEMTWNAAEGTYTLSNVTPGLYVIAANKEVKEYSYSGNVVAVNYQYDGTGVATIADENGVIHVAAKKSSEPTLKKETVENGESKKHGDANIGDTVEFKITLTIPDYNGTWKTDNLHFIISDALSEGLTLDTTSVKIEGTDITDKFVTNKKCADTTVTTSAHGFTLNLYGEDVYQYANATIAITYSAVVNENAKVNFDDETNMASLRYSTTANGTDLSDTTTDTTHHYTFGFDTLLNGTGSATTTELTKFGVKTTTEIDNKVKLEGAQFQLFDSKGTKLYFTEAGRLTTEAAGGRDYIVSKSEGQLTATGLDAGTYTLKESKAPLGYALDKTTYTVVITPTYNEVNGELRNYTVTINDGATNSITFTHQMLDNGSITTTDNAANADTFGINNTPLLTLPETGGAGIVALTVIAIVMMAGFGSMFLLLKKKRA